MSDREALRALYTASFPGGRQFTEAEELVFLRAELGEIREAMGYDRDANQPPDTATLIAEIRRMYLESRANAGPIEYVGAGVIASWFEVATITVGQWRKRHANFPQPDAITGTLQGPVPGWLPARRSDIEEWERTRLGEAWRKGRPGAITRGTVTGRLPHPNPSSHEEARQ